ncbi:5-hydroxytryptamine receptor 3A-like isoform X2 [Megalobrama amblycephala]|uniref:5-hydroxytryptamine receptor 3A-like isoform X2 n=1 Tax=Megalobrama amblycephala TaxID=75352 RepID=UPI0020140B59|nr:5-hydroxytryptamine receptor 3A-like isoform X2 [Megalobrama amblycephala]
MTSYGATRMYKGSAWRDSHYLFRLSVLFCLIASITNSDTGEQMSTWWVSEGPVCSAKEKDTAKKTLYEHLYLAKNDSQNARMLPLIFNEHECYNYLPINIRVNLHVTSIINVDEKAQSLTTLVKMITAWPNLNMMWYPDGFCGIATFAAPKNMFWTPDIDIMESIKKEFGANDSPNVLLFNFGFTVSHEVLSLTTACKMDLYRFPFDTQRCSITLQSPSYSMQEITINTIPDEKNITQESKERFQAQGEWELLDITYMKDILSQWIEVDQLIYQITIKRRPQLYAIKIIVPVFFFLVLDVISFFIDARGANKLIFKVTLLLSISVMLLIDNDTLPSSSERIPLIGIYCCGIFCLIGISILETILVNFLKTKGDKMRSLEKTAAVSGRDDRDLEKLTDSDIYENTSEEQICTSDGLKLIVTKAPAQLPTQQKDQPPTQQNQREKIPLSWTRVAKIIDVTFLILYIITIIVFMSVLWKLWIP